MGQTPPADLRIQDSDPPGAYYVCRRLPGPVADAAWEPVSGPFTTYPDAILGWRLAGSYSRPTPQDLAAWTLVHIDGWCGAEDGGCPHCKHIASKGDRASDRERNLILPSRRNLPRGFGQGLPIDVEALTRIEVLEAHARLEAKL